jgi:hypothetical protein
MRLHAFLIALVLGIASLSSTALADPWRQEYDTRGYNPDGYVWVAGRWAWNGGRWSWVDGHYEHAAAAPCNDPPPVVTQYYPQYYPQYYRPYRPARWGHRPYRYEYRPRYERRIRAY